MYVLQEEIQLNKGSQILMRRVEGAVGESKFCNLFVSKKLKSKAQDGLGSSVGVELCGESVIYVDGSGRSCEEMGSGVV